MNGEIYNHQDLRARYPDYPYKTASDCEVILPMWDDLGPDQVHELDGMFAFVLLLSRQLPDPNIRAGLGSGGHVRGPETRS